MKDGSKGRVVSVYTADCQLLWLSNTYTAGAILQRNADFH